MPRTATLLPLSILAAAAIAGCGAGSPTTGATTSASAAGSSGAPAATRTAAVARAAGLKFSQCMRANGVPNFPDLGSGSGGIRIAASRTAGSGQSLTVNGVPVNGPAFQRAMSKCRRDLPTPPPVSASNLQKLRAGALAMARCMRAHGVTNFPDPVVSAGPGGGAAVRVGGPGVDPTSPAFQAAQRVCGGILARAGGPSGTPGQAG